MSNHYGFFYSDSNSIFVSIQGVSLLPSTYYGGDKHHIIGRGTYMYKDNFRRSVSLFGVRTLIKSNWVNSNDVYLAPVEKING
jgi:hypothetical protein